MPHCFPNTPKAKYTGTLKMEGLLLPCYVLDDERRVLSQEGMIEALGISRGDGGERLATFVGQNRLKPYLPKGLTAGSVEPLRFTLPGGGPEVHGYEATFLVDICCAVVAALRAGVLQKQQAHIAKAATAVLIGSAKLGIIALVDEATGYQRVRAANALEATFVAETKGEWERTFPEELWMQFSRLEGRPYVPGVRPLYWGKYLVVFIYNVVNKDIISRLRELNPEPHHGSNHHQWLTTVGRQQLLRHIDRLLPVMRVCRNMVDFRAKFAHAFNQTPLQEDLFE